MTSSDEDFSKPYRLQYQLGVYLATNAMKDAYAVIDGPDCLFRKAEWVHGKHDLSSTLLDVLGNHRIVSTLVNAEAVIKDRGEMVSERIKQVAKIPGAASVFVCAMPHVMIIGTQYDRILRSLEDAVPMKLMEVPSLSLQGCHLDGYSECLAALAAKIDVSGAVPDFTKVAIVGHFMHRNEADGLADIDEIHRLVHGLDLDVASLWLSGNRYTELSAAKDAGTIVALPLGRKAARILAARTGAQVLDCPVPIGPARTRRFLLEIARATGRMQAFGSFVDDELRRAVPRLEWAVRHLFFGRRVAFAANPDLLAGLYSLATEVGIQVELLATMGRPEHVGEDLASDLPPGTELLFSPSERALTSLHRRLRERGELDAILGDSHFLSLFGQTPHALELGFPSHFEHALFERPTLGFRGWLCLLDRLGQILGRRPGVIRNRRSA